MAQRRMFSKTITNSSQFLMMPSSSQSLYFHLGMNADDDGFCEHFSIMRMTDSKPDDLRILQAKRFVDVFDDRVLVITNWRENNFLRSDRYTKSKYLEIYKEELARLTNGIPNGNQMTTQVRLGKVSIGKDSSIGDKSPTRTKFYVPSIDSIREYMKEIECPNEESDRMFNYYESNGWMVGRNKMKDWKAACRNWKLNLKKYPEKKSQFQNKAIGFDPKSESQQVAYDDIMNSIGEKK
jgi:hypothetical protein